MVFINEGKSVVGLHAFIRVPKPWFQSVRTNQWSAFRTLELDQ